MRKLNLNKLRLILIPVLVMGLIFNSNNIIRAQDKPTSATQDNYGDRVDSANDIDVFNKIVKENVIFTVVLTGDNGQGWGVGQPQKVSLIFNGKSPKYFKRTNDSTTPIGTYSLEVPLAELKVADKYKIEVTYSNGQKSNDSEKPKYSNLLLSESVKQEIQKRESERKISRKLNKVTMTGLNENDKLYLATYSNTSSNQADIVKNEFLIKDGKVYNKRNSIDANTLLNISNKIQFEYDKNTKTVTMIIPKNIDEKNDHFIYGIQKVYLGYKEAATNESGEHGTWFLTSDIKKDLENSKTAFKKLTPSQKEDIQNQLSGLSEGIKGNQLPKYTDGVLNSKLSIEGIEPDTDEDNGLVVGLKNDQENKTIINTITYEKLQPNEQYTLKGTLNLLEEDNGYRIKEVKKTVNTEFTSNEEGTGTVVLKFENTELEAGNIYSVDVTATSKNKFLYQEGTKQHQADPKETGDPNLTFVVEKEEVEQNDESSENPKQDDPQAPEMKDDSTEGKDKKIENKEEKPSENGSTKPQPEASQPQAPEVQPQTPPESSVPAPKPENNITPLTKQTPTLVSNTSLNIVIDNNQTLVVKTSADLSTFKEVRVDGKVIDKTNYDLKEGSTIITLKASYLNTLSEGTHKLEIVSNESNTYKAHTVTVLFTIQKPKQTVTHNPNWQQDLRKHNEFINKTQPKTSLPNTGYVSNHSILLASTLLTLVAYKLYKKED